jgi:hypothetical protein
MMAGHSWGFSDSVRAPRASHRKGWSEVSTYLPDTRWSIKRSKWISMRFS